MITHNFIKKAPRLVLGLFLHHLLLMGACSSPDKQVNLISVNRIIQFSGYDWVVRSSDNDKEGPGPNYFSDSEDNVWVDNEGQLHLKIVEKDGLWYCSGVSLHRSYGFHKYVFYLNSNIDDLDDNMVAGLFTYMNDEEEIDIEFSKWSDPENENSQFAVQPSHLASNKKRFGLDQKCELTTHFFDWKPNVIEFASYNGHGLDQDNIINTWTYTGENIPPDSYERLKINLWLYRGNSPKSKKEAEIVINRVEIL